MQSNLVSAPPQFSSKTTSVLRPALVSSATGGSDGQRELRHALRLLSEESRARGFTAEEMVVALRGAWHSAGRIQRLSDEPDRSYYAALGELLAIYFGEEG